MTLLHKEIKTQISHSMAVFGVNLPTLTQAKVFSASEDAGKPWVNIVNRMFRKLSCNKTIILKLSFDQNC